MNTYDSLGRLHTTDYGNGTTIAYTYDGAGNRLSQTITNAPPPPDATPPNSLFAVINQAGYPDTGAPDTASTSVILSIAATDNVGVTGYCALEQVGSTPLPNPVASDPCFVDVTSAASYNADVSFTLSDPAGEKLVYVWFKDAAGNVSFGAGDTITFLGLDIDGDGVPNDLDAFPNDARYSQDADGDGIADEWEILYFGDLLTADATTDSDGDGLSDRAEFFSGSDPTVALTTGLIERVSLVNGSTAEGSGPSYEPVLSADGRFAAFASYSNNLVPVDNHGWNQIFVRDRQTGLTEMVSVGSGGDSGDRGSDRTAISSDGNYVAFDSNATNLVAADQNGTYDVFVRDRQAGTTELLSVDSGGNAGDGASFSPAMSGDGRFVAFRSSASNLVAGDTNGNSDIFVRDRINSTTELVSVSSGGAQGDSWSDALAISEDGGHVAFVSNASNLVDTDTNGFTDIFVRDLQTGTTERVSVDSTGIEGNGDSTKPRLSGDGSFVVFASSASNLVPEDTNGSQDIFVRDRQTGNTTRVSVDSGGGQGNGASGWPSISADGRYVIFQSEASNLVIGDNNGTTDVFIHDRQTQMTVRVSEDGAGGGGNGQSAGPTISADGKYAAFHSYASNLVAGDTNGSLDVFVYGKISFNQPPEANDDAYATLLNTPIPVVDVLANDIDPEGGLMVVNSFDANSALGGLVAVNADNTLAYTPPSGYVGLDTFTYTAADSDGAVSNATVTITITAPDSDNDGVPDNLDSFPQDPAASVDTDSDGYPDAWNAGATPTQIAASPLTLDAFPTDSTEWIDTDGDGIGNNADPDDDNDGYSDSDELAAGSDPLNALITPEICDGIDNDVDGAIDEGFADTDADGIADCVDACPNDTANDADGDGVCGDVDICPGADDTLDTDADGVPDCLDACVDDPAKTDPGICGCGVADTDIDADGLADCVDPDIDNDGLTNDDETGLYATDPLVFDTDGDGFDDGTEVVADSDPLDSGVLPGSGTTTLESVSTLGALGTRDSDEPSISADGRYVAFTSFANNLVAGDSNGDDDVFVRDLVTGETTLISVNSSGIQGDSGSVAPTISADGRYVAFGSGATNLAEGATNGGQPEIFVHDRVTGETTWVTESLAGTESNGGSWSSSIGSDGRFVAFYSSASDLVFNDSNGTDDVFVRDLTTGQTSIVSVDSTGVQGDSYSRFPTISADGRYVAFTSHASNLDAGDINGADDVFVHDLQTGETTLLSVSSAGVQGNSWSDMPSISADGRYVAFRSFASNLVVGDTNDVEDVYVRDRLTGQTTRISVSSDGDEADNFSEIPSISGDGRYVAFASAASNLVGGDTNDALDVFVHDQATGQTLLVSTDSSGAQGDARSFDPTISGHGRYIAFGSDASTLVQTDTNGWRDVFVRDRFGRASEVCDGSDSNGDGQVDEGFPDTDADGQADCVDVDDDNDGYTDAEETAAGSGPLNASSTPEVCDGADNDLDGSTDEGFTNTDGDTQADCVDTDDDNDGLTDADETGLYGTNPLIADSDGDGLTDGEEIGTYGTLPLDADTDGDGYTDGEEVSAGSDPNDPGSVPAVVTGDPIVWADIVGVATGGPDGNTLTKTAGDGWGNGGAASLQSIPGDGGVVFTATETDTSRMLGLSSANADASFNTIGYAIFARAGGDVRVFENGTNRGTYGTYQSGDELGVRRTGTTVEYTLNGVVIYASTVPSSGALIADAALYNSGATLTDARIVAPPPPPVQDAVWTDLVGVSGNGGSLDKTAPNGWGNGGAASLQSIPGDGGVVFTATETDTSRMLGLSSANADANFNTIGYAIFARAGGDVRVFENGTNRGTYGTYQSGDELGVRRTGTTVAYTLNGVVIYTSTVPSSGTLIADAALYHIGATVTDAQIGDVSASGSTEVCDGIDNDGNGQVDEGFPDTDADGQADCVDVDDDNDGYTDAEEATAGSDPLNAASTPEVCDGIDNDLDGQIDEGFPDEDGDGLADCVDLVLHPIGPQTVNEGQLLRIELSWDNPFGGQANVTTLNLPPGMVLLPERIYEWTPTFSQAGVYTMTTTITAGGQSDSETFTITVNDVQPEVCDGVDNNGDGQVDEGFADTDGDGQADCVDPDDDNDGLTDTDETGIYGTNPLIADTDGDGYSDGAEVSAGSDPNDPGSIPPAATGDPIVWTDLVGVAAGGPDGSTLTKTAGDSWGNGGAASVQLIPADGGVVFTATETNTSRMLGLSSVNADASFNTIQYAIFARAGGQVRVFENGVNRGTFGTYQSGDELGVRRIGTFVEYTLNGAVIYTSTVLSSGALLADAALYHQGATLTAARIVTPPPPPVQDVVWTNLVGTVTSTPGGSNLTKTAANGWGNGGASSVQRIPTDGGVSFIVAETDRSRMLGLSAVDTDANYTTIDYAIFARAGGEVRVFERGTNMGTFGTYATGTVLGVERVGTTIRYTIDGAAIYTSAVPSSGDLVADAALYHQNATIFGPVIHGGIP